jgi:hypothetical protein
MTSRTVPSMASIFFRRLCGKGLAYPQSAGYLGFISNGRDQMTFEFQNTLHRSARDLADAIAEAWLSANGANSRDTQVEALRTTSDEALAAEAIEGWGLDQTESEDSTLTWMEAREIDASDIASGFAILRAVLI